MLATFGREVVLQVYRQKSDSHFSPNKFKKPSIRPINRSIKALSKSRMALKKSKISCKNPFKKSIPIF